MAYTWSFPEIKGGPPKNVPNFWWWIFRMKAIIHVGIPPFNVRSLHDEIRRHWGNWRLIESTSWKTTPEIDEIRITTAGWIIESTSFSIDQQKLIILWILYFDPELNDKKNLQEGPDPEWHGGLRCLKSWCLQRCHDFLGGHVVTRNSF